MEIMFSQINEKYHGVRHALENPNVHKNSKWSSKCEGCILHLDSIVVKTHNQRIIPLMNGELFPNHKKNIPWCSLYHREPKCANKSQIGVP